MTQVTYDDLLIKTHVLRVKKTATSKHYIYVLHNSMFLHPTCYIDEPEIVYRKEVTSQECETQLHRLMDAYHIKKTREFYDCPLQQIIEFIEML